MSKDYQTIIREIVSHITKKCMFTDISDFYVGVSSEPEINLFIEHGVSKDFGCWTYAVALNVQHAREAEKKLIEQGMNGSSGGDDESGTSVYCYKITPETEE